MLDTLNKVKNTNMVFAKAYLPEHQYVMLERDNEHYKLLAHLANNLHDATIYDIGTYKGLSAIAMASNPSNCVVSYDIGNFLDCTTPTNVEFKIGDCYLDPGMLESPLISLDVDPHDGEFEKQFISYLVANDYKGIVICDDIHLNPQMQDFWDSVTVKKFDVTEVGHYSGTGMIVFE
jgi:hypothetical protein